MKRSNGAEKGPESVSIDFDDAKLPGSPSADAAQDQVTLDGVSDTEVSLPCLDLPRISYSPSPKHRIDEATLASLRPLVHQLAEEFGIPVPLLGFVDRNKFGAAWSDLNVVAFGYPTVPEDAASILVHEMTHLWQAKYIAAVKIAEPENYADFDIEESIVEAARTQRLHENPLALSTGRRFAESARSVRRAEEIGSLGYDDGIVHTTYDRSLEELTARLGQIDFEKSQYAEQAKKEREKATDLRKKIDFSYTGFKALLGSMICDFWARQLEKRAARAAGELVAGAEVVAQRWLDGDDNSIL